jgi:hypothetical protein
MDPKAVLEEIISNSVAKSYGKSREEIASGAEPRPICIDGMIDGGKATEHKSMVICLLRVVDKAIVKALTSTEDIFNKDPDLLDWEGVHSLRSTFIMGIIFGSDTVENCKKVAGKLFSFMEHLHNLHEEKKYYECGGLFYDFDVSWPADMKAHNAIQERGGGSYMTHWFCMCCDVTNHTKGKVSAFRCSNCSRYYVCAVIYMLDYFITYY